MCQNNVYLIDNLIDLKEKKMTSNKDSIFIIPYQVLDVKML